MAENKESGSMNVTLRENSLLLGNLLLVLTRRLAARFLPIRF
jgi:hypothetical protein